MIGNNATCIVTRIDSIRIRMNDGIVRELSNIKHVPELKRNFIYLSMLDKVGYIVE